MRVVRREFPPEVMAEAALWGLSYGAQAAAERFDATVAEVAGWMQRMWGGRPTEATAFEEVRRFTSRGDLMVRLSCERCGFEVVVPAGTVLRHCPECQRRTEVRHEA